jgi:hypothetical protein
MPPREYTSNGKGSARRKSLKPEAYQDNFSRIFRAFSPNPPKGREKKKEEGIDES